MAKEKQSVLVVSTQKNLLATLKSNYKEFERVFKHWLVNDAFSSACVAFVSGAIPYTFGPEYALPHRFTTFATKHVNTNPLLPLIPVFIGGGRLEMTRNLAIWGGVYNVMDCAMRRLRGKEDIQTSLVRSFSSGVVVSLVCGVNSVNAISNGVLLTLLDVAIFKIRGESSNIEEHVYKDSENMLCVRGPEKNLKNGMLTDKTLPLLKEREEVKKRGTSRENCRGLWECRIWYFGVILRLYI